jgi:3-methyladenine DNA glycosylase AlkD
MCDNPWFPTRVTTVSSDFYQYERQQSDLMFLRRNIVVQLNIYECNHKFKSVLIFWLLEVILGDFHTEYESE